ncbi:MAG: hypothetical protein GY851_33670 [bacterium]|nr:hypothetical protein [bacterium]
MTWILNRREVLALGATSIASTALAAQEDSPVTSSLIQAHDKKLKSMLDGQVTDLGSKWRGAIPDHHGLHSAHSAARLLREGAAAYFHPQSAFHADDELYDRMGLAAGFLERSQTDDGNIDLLSTNFNSPPDTGFVVHSVGTAARLTQMNDHAAMLSLLLPFLVKAGLGMAKGGVHTPNHRWVVCAALAQIHEVYPDTRFVKRIDEWLAESIDIDEEGQYTERSTAGYNAVVNHALVVTAHKLNRPELLDAVRKNLDAMAYLLHPNNEVVTSISRRQDLNTRGTMANYWFPLRYMALRDDNGMYASMLAPHEPGRIELAFMMEYPELERSLPAPTPIPQDYVKHYAISGITRIRHGRTSATILHEGRSRWIAMRQGEAVINGVRFASSFFGKGQFVPKEFERRDDGYHFKQELDACYYQPVKDASLLPVTAENAGRLRSRREKTEQCRMVYEGHIRETSDGFEITIEAHGTDGVPLSVEVNLRDGGEVTGVTPAPRTGGAFLLKEGFAEYRMGSDTIRFGPGHCEHAYVQVRGAEGKLSGPSVYLTGFTPFKHTLKFALRT